MNSFFLKIIFYGTYDLAPDSFCKKWDFTESTFNIKSNKAQIKRQRKEEQGKQWWTELGACGLTKRLFYIITKNIWHKYLMKIYIQSEK